MRVIFQEVNVENISKGKNNYQIATVTYTSGGRNMTQKLVSFANPASFAAVNKLTQGQEIEVEVTKNDAGYNQWASVKPVVADESAPAAKGGVASKAPVSQYETREERQVRQLHIVRQSSLSNAIAALTPGAKAALKPEDVIEAAQVFVDFVYSDSTDDLATPNSDFQDVPV